MRGMACLLIFFHHSLQVPAGGFLGVDVFFVLSGFLISSLIMEEIENRGSFDFRQFYWRRAVRLLPAFVCMVMLYQALRLAFTPGLISVGPRRAAEILFLSDWTTVTPYLGHTWSLAVEWQFYCAWPAAIAIVMRLGFGRWTIATIAVLGIACLWAATVASGMNAARGEGLFLGSVLACVTGKAWLRLQARRTLVGWLSSVGFAVSLAVLLTLCFGMSYRSPNMGNWVYAAGSALSLAIIISLLAGGSMLSRIVLGNRVMVHFGRISYGLYLYHFPVSSFMVTNHKAPVFIMLACVIAAMPLADCSWRYLEQPLLRAERSLSRRFNPRCFNPKRYKAVA